MSLCIDKEYKSASEDHQQDIQTIASILDTVKTTYFTKKGFISIRINFNEKLRRYINQSK